MSIDLPNSVTPAQIDAAAALLDAGQLVAFPTETVYGLGGDAANPEAVARIYAAKGRPANHPVIVHLPPGGDPGYWVEDLPDDARKLIDAFWPGPLTLILKRHARIPDAVSGGQDSVGLRCPSHPVAQALLAAFSTRRGGHGGVAAPSANRFGHVSPTTAQHVRDEFGDTVHVLDGGASEVGIQAASGCDAQSAGSRSSAASVCASMSIQHATTMRPSIDTGAPARWACTPIRRNSRSMLQNVTPINWRAPRRAAHSTAAASIGRTDQARLPASAPSSGVAAKRDSSQTWAERGAGCSSASRCGNTSCNR